MASYPPPTSIVSIYNPSLFPDKNEPLTEADANLKYIQTSNVNQSSGGTKTFSDFRASDIAFTAPGKPLRWESGGGNGTQRIVPIPTTLFDKQYRLPLDNNYTTDDLVGRQSSATLLNKTISAGTFTGQSMFTGFIYGNNSTSYPLTRSFKTSRTSSNANPAVISYGMGWPIGGDTYGADSAGTYLVSMSLRSGDFGLNRAMWFGLVEMSGFAGGKCSVWTIVSSNVASVTNDTFGNITITFNAGVTPNTAYEITQTQVCY